MVSGRYRNESQITILNQERKCAILSKVTFTQQKKKWNGKFRILIKYHIFNSPIFINFRKFYCEHLMCYFLFFGWSCLDEFESIKNSKTFWNFLETKSSENGPIDFEIITFCYCTGMIDKYHSEFCFG